MAVDSEGYGGVWRTVRGTRIFIRAGEDLDSAIKRHNETADEKEYRKYVEAKDFGFESDYSDEEWERLEKKYNEKYQEEIEKEWYWSVKTDPKKEDWLKDNSKFKKAEKKYKKEFEKWQKENYEKKQEKVFRVLEAMEKRKKDDDE